MTWNAHLTHTPTGLALTFAEPISRLDMTPDVAEHLASLIAVEARHAMRGVLSTLEAESGSRAVVQRGSQKRLYICTTDAHPLCCDCLNCMNGIREVSP
jgi:hypothetical protein